MKSPAQEISEILTQSKFALSLVLWSNLFLDTLPETPDSCIAIFNSAGISPLSIYETYEFPSVQIIVRGDKGRADTAYTLAHNIKTALHKLTDEILGSTRYIQITLFGDIMSLGFDDSQRPLYSLNFNTHRTYS